MKLLVVVLCLLSERFLIHSFSSLRFSWFGDYIQLIKKNIDKNNFFENHWITLAAFVLPVVVPVFIIYILFKSILFGFFGLVLSIMIFFYCLGPVNVFYPNTEVTVEDSGTMRAGNYFAQANSQFFTVLFWYIIAGPIAALSYRLIDLCKEVTPVQQEAMQLTGLLEWIPARITALLYLLVGNFQRGFPSFKQYFLSKPGFNNQLLSESGLQAVRINEIDNVPISVAETLVEHAIIVLLVFIALFTLVAWL